MPPTNDNAPTSDAGPDPASTTDPPSTNVHARILKIGAGVYAVLGTGIGVWMVDKWIRYPEIRAAQFDSQAPFWPAATIFVVLSTIAGVMLLWKGAQRAESGENLFQQRHRRSLKDMRRDRETAAKSAPTADSAASSGPSTDDAS